MFKKNLDQIEKEKEERRKQEEERLEKQYKEDAKQRFNLSLEQRPTATKFEKKLEEYKQIEDSKLNFSGQKAKAVPNFDKVEAPVKLTAAAVKREALALKKAEEQEAKRLKDLELNQRDEKEFMTWKQEMDERDEILRLEHIQRKKIEMELSREEAILAQQRKEQENKINAKHMKIESNVRLEEREKNKEEDLSKKAKIVEQVQSQKEKASEAIEEKKKENREIRDQIHKEVNDMLTRKKLEEEIEMKRKQELIMQIRELEKIPIVRTKGFDPTETGGYGLLEEMSIAELRERLEFNKRQIEQDTELKRQQNLEQKNKEAMELMSTASKIEEARQKRKLDNDLRREEKKRRELELEQKKKEIRDKNIVQAYDRINKKKQDKKAEDERLAKELKEIRLNRQYMNANAAMVEEKAWKELEAGAERQIRNI